MRLVALSFLTLAGLAAMTTLPTPAAAQTVGPSLRKPNFGLVVEFSACRLRPQSRACAESLRQKPTSGPRSAGIQGGNANGSIRRGR